MVSFLELFLLYDCFFFFSKPFFISVFGSGALIAFLRFRFLVNWFLFWVSFLVGSWGVYRKFSD